MNLLIDERDIKAGLKVVTRFYSFFEMRFGIFSLIEKLKIQYPKSQIFYSHRNSLFQNAFIKRNPSIKNYHNETIDKVFYPNLQIWNIIHNIKNQIEEDYELAILHNIYQQPLQDDLNIIGNKKDILVSKHQNIQPFVIFDTRKGKIIIEENVEISPFSIIKGPIFIGKNSQIDKAQIESSIIGKNCKIGGEVSNSIIQDFTNKHHEGFLGHSFVSSWVNIGAIATTSDLKNNYGIIKLQEENEFLNTNCIKFGSILGNFVKIGIGTMLNTGTIIDIGSNIFGNQTKKYVEGFSWGLDKKYEITKFIQDTKKVLNRRNTTLPCEEEDLLKYLYKCFI